MEDMSITAKSRWWLQKVSSKLEDLCVGVASSVCAPVPMDVLENQFQTVQTNFGDFYSEFVEEVHAFIFSHSNNYGRGDTIDLHAGQERSNIGIEGDNNLGDWVENLPSNAGYAATDELLVDTPLQQSHDTNLSSPATTDELLVNTPLRQSDDLAMKERPSEVLKKLNPVAENDFVEEKNLSPETLELVCPAPSDSLTDVSDGRSDHNSAGVAEDDHVTEQGVETIQPNDKELDETIFIADDEILLSNSVPEAKMAPYQEYIWEIVASKVTFVEKQEYESESFEDVNAEADYQLIEEESVTLTPLLAAQDVKSSPDQDSSDSDWEII